MHKLTDEQVKQKLIEGRNYKRLYTELKVRFDIITGQLKQENAELCALLNQALEQNQTQAIQIAELQTMVFGRKNRFRSGGGHKLPGPPRDAASYRRPLPPTSAITNEAHHAIDVCKHCGDPLVDKKTYTRYEEDIRARFFAQNSEL